jgi:hypothetical protein
MMLLSMFAFFGAWLAFLFWAMLDPDDSQG